MALQNKNKIRSVVICPDKFKGGLKSAEVASAIKEGLENYILDRKGEESLFSQDICFDIAEMADGGDGSAGLFAKLTGGRMVECEVCGPLGNNVPSCYVLGKDSDWLLLWNVPRPVAWRWCLKKNAIRSIRPLLGWGSLYVMRLRMGLLPFMSESEALRPTTAALECCRVWDFR